MWPIRLFVIYGGIYFVLFFFSFFFCFSISKIRSGSLCPFSLYLTASFSTWKSKYVHQVPFANNLNLSKHAARKCFIVFSQEFIRTKSTSESLLKLSIRLQICYMKNWKDINILFVPVCYF